MPDTYRIEWTYTPAGFFEAPVELTASDWRFAIDNGRVIGTALYEAPQELARLASGAHQEIEALFMGAQVLEHERFSLSEPGSILRIDANGTQHATVICGVGHMVMVPGRVDVQIGDPNGNVQVGTRQERISARNAMAKRALSRFSDRVANAIVRSYNAAVSDSRNELVHPYEIRDALHSRFKSERAVRNAVGLSHAKWSEFGRLTCVEPLIEGRHRSEHPGALRPATREELDKARSIAREMILGYFRWLETP